MTTIESIFTKENMMKAANKVAKKSSAGIDGIPANEIRAIIDQNYNNIFNELVNGQFRPQEVRIVKIPKRNGGIRNIAIATALDRCIQCTLNLCLYPIFEMEWSEYSYGFRKSRNCKMAINQVFDYIKEGYTWAIKLDLSGCFDNINQHKILYRIRKKIDDERIITLIKRYLKVTYVSNQDKWTNNIGTPQGSPLSPLFAEMILMDIDKEFIKRGLRFVRYADDIIILAKTETSANRIMNNATCFIQNKCNLPVNKGKAYVKPIRDGIDYLGFFIYMNNQTVHCIPSHKREQSLKSKIKTECLERKPDEAIIRINEIVRGWLEYYLISECHTRCKSLDLYINKQLTKYEKRNGITLDKSGLISLSRLYEEKRHLLKEKADGNTDNKKQNEKGMNDEASSNWCRDPPNIVYISIL